MIDIKYFSTTKIRQWNILPLLHYYKIMDLLFKLENISRCIIVPSFYQEIVYVKIYINVDTTLMTFFNYVYSVSILKNGLVLNSSMVILKDNMPDDNDIPENYSLDEIPNMIKFVDTAIRKYENTI